MSTNPALAILGAAARALAHDESLESILDVVLGALTRDTGIASAAVFATRDEPGQLAIAAWIGFGDPAALSAAVRRPGHPIARTMDDGVASFDVQPTAPGGPVLRSHLPLMVHRDGQAVAVGVLAIAHDQSLGRELRQIVEAAADLIAVAIERDRAAR